MDAMNGAAHPWKSAVDEFENDVLPLLKEHGKDIGRRSRTGDETCQRIIGHYSLLQRSFDPMTLVFLRDDLDKYIAAVAKDVMPCPDDEAQGERSGK